MQGSITLNELGIFIIFALIVVAVWICRRDTEKH